MKTTRKMSKSNLNVRNPKNPYIDSIKRVLKYQKELQSFNTRNKIPDLEKWTVKNWEPNEGAYDVLKLLKSTIDKRIADSTGENIFSRAQTDKENEMRWGKFFELIRYLSENYGYINLQELVG